MLDINKISLLGLIFGIMGTTLGGIVGSFLNVKTNKKLGFILEFAAGLMTAIICFDLIPESLENGNITSLMIGILLGICSMIFLDELVKNLNKKSNKVDKNNHFIKTGMIIFIGLTLHNFPEGLAIGAGFEASSTLGLSLAIAVAIHDVPEGISIAVPLKEGGENNFKTIILTMISGITTGIGAFFGAIVGNISKELISGSLALAAGAMLYIVSCELIPESKNMYKGRFTSFGNILGIIIGLFAHVCL